MAAFNFTRWLIYMFKHLDKRKWIDLCHLCGLILESNFSYCDCLVWLTLVVWDWIFQVDSPDKDFWWCNCNIIKKRRRLRAHRSLKFWVGSILFLISKLSRCLICWVKTDSTDFLGWTLKIQLSYLPIDWYFKLRYWLGLCLATWW